MSLVARTTSFRESPSPRSLVASIRPLLLFPWYSERSGCHRNTPRKRSTSQLASFCVEWNVFKESIFLT